MATFATIYVGKVKKLSNMHKLKLQVKANHKSGLVARVVMFDKTPRRHDTQGHL